MAFASNNSQYPPEIQSLLNDLYSDPAAYSPNEQLKKIKDFFPEVQHKVNMNTEQIDVSDDTKIGNFIDDGRIQLFTAVAKTPTKWEDSIFKKLYCDIFMERIRKQSADDEQVLKENLWCILRTMSFETLLWIKDALDSRKIANIFEIFTKNEKLPAVVEKDRQKYKNSIKDMIFSILMLFICRYQVKVAESGRVSDDLKFIHNKYMKFFQDKETSLPKLYKMIKNFQSDFVKSCKQDFERTSVDYITFIVVVEKDLIRIVCHNLTRSIMYMHQNGNKTFKDVKVADLPYGKYYYNFFNKTGVSREGRKIFYSLNDEWFEPEEPTVLRMQL